MKRYELIQTHKYRRLDEPQNYDSIPSIAITQCLGSPHLNHLSPTPELSNNQAVDASHATRRWYGVFSLGTRVVCRELDPSLPGYQTRSLASLQFNCLPTALSVIERRVICESYNKMQCLIGFNNGMVLQWSPFNKDTSYSNLMYNKDAKITSHSVTAIQNVPSIATVGASSPSSLSSLSSSSFLVAHSDGCIYQYAYDSPGESPMSSSLPTNKQPHTNRVNASIPKQSPTQYSVLTTQTQREAGVNPRKTWKISFPGSTSSIITDMKFSHNGKHMYIYVCVFVYTRIRMGMCMCTRIYKSRVCQ
jgi:hypothetical protein